MTSGAGRIVSHMCKVAQCWNGCDGVRQFLQQLPLCLGLEGLALRKQSLRHVLGPLALPKPKPTSLYAGS